MEVVHARCAGLDVHKKSVVACVRVQEGDRVRHEVRTFDTTTRALLELAAWLAEHRCTQAVLESTGVYWKPVWHILAGAELTLVLANAEHVRALRGRKTDVKDAVWLSDLLAHGLVASSFVPPEPIAELRDLTRTRRQLVRQRIRHVQRIQKVLEDANIKLDSVISDVLGKSGRAIVEALVAGQTDPRELLKLASTRLHAPRAQLVEALHGRVTPHHRMMLRLHLQQVDATAATIAEIDQEVERLLEPFQTHVSLLNTIRLAYDGKLLGAVCRIFIDSVMGWYQRRLALCGAMKGKSGAVTVIQRVASDLRLHPHFHAIFLDGVYVQNTVGGLEFVQLPRLRTSEVADAVQVVRARILNYLERRGVVEGNDELSVLDDELSVREPALSQLARAAVSGIEPAGPELRRRPEPIVLRGRPGVEVTRPLCAQELGFNLHAATRSAGLDEAGREGLLKYVLRPPVATERIEQGPDGLVRIALKRPFSDGAIAIDLDPLSLLCRLCASVPAPKTHTVRYAGVLAAHSSWRSLIIPTAPPAPPDSASAMPVQPNGQTPPPPPRGRSVYRPWAQLLKRTFGIDVEQCLRCGGRMRLSALVISVSSITRILRHLGEPTEPPARAPARGPPYFATRAARRKLAEPQQTVLFE
jgi:transposase